MQTRDQGSLGGPDGLAAARRWVYAHFKDRPHDYEQFAADIWRVNEPKADKIDVARAWRDGR